ncbi:MAG TPA: FAD-binding protein, partial [Candidatus Saccharimonadales bacterium]|nr:FAD-binding protein [Candidatus Saccharimonadales bacterium]
MGTNFVSRQTYSKLTQSDMKELSSIVGESNVLTDDSDLVVYARDKSMTPYSEWFSLRPEIALLPASTEEVLKIVKFANKRRIPITPRSGGCGFTG